MRRALILALIAPLAGPVTAQDVGEPLSAIDWLSNSVRSPDTTPSPSTRGNNLPTTGEAPIAGQVLTPSITVTPLDSGGPRAIGTRLPSDSGLSADLWRASPAGDLAQVLGAVPRAPIPALQDLVRRLLLTRADGPLQSQPDAFTLMRVDHLLEMGALSDAQALLDAASVTSPELFRRYFDAALLRGNDEDACKIMELTPSVAPTFAARVFCLAGGGDWSAAALTFGTARALGELSPTEDSLIAHYLDPDLYEGEPIPPVEGIPSPLLFRVREAIGAPVPTAPLPKAYRVSDLRHHIGWKYQIEAAEVLASSGVLAPSELLAIYSAGRPSASGGVWDRARAVQRIDAALGNNDVDAVSAALPAAWRTISTASVQVPLAALWGERLAALELSDAAQDVARDIALLSQDFTSAEPKDDLLGQIAGGTVPQVDPHSSPFEQAIARAFTPDANLPETLANMAQQGRVGEVLLRAVALFEAGRDGDPVAMEQALAVLIHLGQENVARRAALQYLLLGAPA